MPGFDPFFPVLPVSHSPLLTDSSLTAQLLALMRPAVEAGGRAATLAQNKMKVLKPYLVIAGVAALTYILIRKFGTRIPVVGQLFA